MINWQSILFDLVIIESAIFLFFAASIPFHHLCLHFKSDHSKKQKTEIKQIIIAHLLKNTKKPPLSLLEKFSGTYVLLKTLEAFEKRICGKRWVSLKNQINQKYLLPSAQKLVSSFFWSRRYFSARVFALTPLPEDEKKVLKLLQDPVFLVRAVAAKAAVKIKSQQGIERVIKNMSTKRGYARLYYQNLFSDLGFEAFNWIQEIAKEYKDDEKIHLACLEILSEKALSTVPDYIVKDQKSKNVTIRKNAAKIIARNPHQNTLNLLKTSLEDTDGDVRAEAIKGLTYFPSDDTIEQLSNLVNDPEWSVSINAKNTLDKLCKNGNFINA